MKQSAVFLSKALIRGLLIVVPVYLAVLLLLKGMKSVANLVSPLAQLLPAWVPAEQFLSLLLVLAICVAIGAYVGTRVGEGIRSWIERTVFERIPGYGLIRSLTDQVAGRSRETTWTAALIEIEDALVPAFIIEELEDGRYTVFVPSIPTPFAGAVTFSTGSGCIRWTCRSRRRSGSSPAGARGEGPRRGDGERRQVRREPPYVSEPAGAGLPGVGPSSDRRRCSTCGVEVRDKFTTQSSHHPPPTPTAARVV